MANRELSQDLEVKVDTKEIRNRLTSEYPNAKNWTRFNVKIEAIQCFPCYVKVTLVRTHADTTSHTDPLIVRITVPGLLVQLAASRTKPHCYGLFWKSNRKRCAIFLAFPSEQDRCMHMAWMKDSIQELQKYRQDFLDIRRASRCSAEVTDQQIRLTDVFGNYQNLGPLPPVPMAIPAAAATIAIPAVPVDSIDWSRRQSTVSEIYEEIGDPLVSLREKHEGHSANKDSGIYERLPRNPSQSSSQNGAPAQIPPPLPPRQRLNTLEMDDGLGSSVGSNTSDSLKKKKYKTVLESIFGKHSANSRKTSESSCGSGTAEDAARERLNADLLTHLTNNTWAKNKRHSISTPELANWEDDQGCGSGGLASSDQHEDLSAWQDVSCMSLLSESLDISAELNISDRIRPNFNLSMNVSNVNLVGCNFNAMRESEIGLRNGGSSSSESDQSEIRRSLNQMSGYCVMRPIPPSKSEDEEHEETEEEEEGVAPLPHEATKNVLNESSGYCPMGPQGFDREHVNKMDHQPVRGIVFNEDNVQVWNLSHITMTRGSGETAPEETIEDESFLRRKVKTETPREDEELYENCRTHRVSVGGSKYLVDDKIPSYLPNDSPPHPSAAQLTPPKLQPKQKSRSSMTPSPRLQHYSPRAVPNIYSVPRNNSPVLMDNARDTELLKQSLTDSISKLSLISSSPLSQTVNTLSPKTRNTKRHFSERDEPDGESQNSSPLTSPAKALNAQVPPKYVDKCSLKADFANLKRFASLPRFRKLDLSPLRIKLNSVLHRHNSEF